MSANILYLYFTAEQFRLSLYSVIKDLTTTYATVCMFIISKASVNQPLLHRLLLAVL